MLALSRMHNVILPGASGLIMVIKYINNNVTMAFTPTKNTFQTINVFNRFSQRRSSHNTSGN
jgi:hypothetical protein